MNLQYLPATEQDIDTIFALSKALIHSYEDLSSIAYDSVMDWVSRKIRKNIFSYTCVYREGQKVGYYRLSPEGDCMELDDLYVLPPFRGQGIGSAVVTRCIEQTQLPIMLYVFTRNTRAIALYQRMGFRIDRAVSPTRCIMIRENL